MDDITCAWAAGFFDGEGSINISLNLNVANGRTYHVLAVEVAQVDPRPLLRLQENWGGKIRGRAPSTPRARPSLMWYHRNGSGEMFLRDIRPWSIVKAEQIDIALAFRETFRRPGGSARLLDGVTDLRNDLKRQLEEGRR